MVFGQKMKILTSAKTHRASQEEQNSANLIAPSSEELWMQILGSCMHNMVKVITAVETSSAQKTPLEGAIDATETRYLFSLPTVQTYTCTTIPGSSLERIGLSMPPSL